MSKSKRFMFSAVLLAAIINHKALATEITVAHFERGVVPVLVNVDKHGKVTKVSASDQLQPALERLLRQTVDVVVSSQKPLAEEGGQVVMRFRLDTTQRADGKYDARFVVLDTKSVPSGAWSWFKAGPRYALVDQLGRGSVPRYDRSFERQEIFRRNERQPPSPPPPQPIPPASTRGTVTARS
ncbi:MAG: hypothetical protein ABWX87_02300 [Pseudoxanthomonas sp.]